MDPVPAPQPEVDELVVRAITPRRVRPQVLLPYLLGLLLFLTLLGTGLMSLSPRTSPIATLAPVTTNQTATSSATRQQTDVSDQVTSGLNFSLTGPNNPSGKIFYAKQVLALDGPTPIRIPVYSIYQADPSGANKKLLITQASVADYFRDFQILKTDQLLLLNLGSKLETYNLRNGERKTIYRGRSGVDRVVSALESPDHTKLALSVDDRESANHFAGRRIIIVSLAEPKIIQSASVDNSLINQSLRLSLKAWGQNNSTLYLYGGSEGPGELWRLDLGTKKFTELATRVGESLPSSDQGSIGFIDDTAGTARWDKCSQYGTYSTSLQMINTSSAEVTIFESDPSLDFLPVRWSPDNKTMLFTFRQFISMNGDNPADCKIAWGTEVAKLYFTSSKTEQTVSSKDAQIKAWYPRGPVVVDGTDTNGAERGLTFNGGIIEPAAKDRPVRFIGDLIP